MDFTNLSGTAEYSDKEAEELLQIQKPSDFNEIPARLILTDEQVTGCNVILNNRPLDKS